MTPQLVWTVQTILAALAAGVFAISATFAWCNKGEKFQMSGIVIVAAALAISFAIIFARLGHPERVFGAFQNMHSPITQELSAVIIAGIMLAIYFNRWRKNNAIPGILAAASVLVSVFVAIVFANPYLMPFRMARNTIMLSLSVLALAGVLGSLVVYFLAGFTGEDPGLQRIINRSVLASFGVLIVIGSIYAIVIANTKPFTTIPLN